MHISANQKSMNVFSFCLMCCSITPCLLLFVLPVLVCKYNRIVEYSFLNMKNNLPFLQVKPLEGLPFVDAHLR